MTCKACGKELIGKEKFFCRNCWSKGTDALKKTASWAGGLVLSALALGKAADVVKKDYKRSAKK